MNIYTKAEGRLGNNMIQYVFSKILSEETKSNFYLLFDLPEEFGLEYNKVFSYPKDACTLQEKWDGYNVKLYLNNELIDENISDIVSKLKTIDSNNLIVSGYFQNISYYYSKKDYIKSLFKLKKKKEIETLGIHVRKGDVSGTQNDLPNEWFTNMITKFPQHKKYVTTDDPNDDIVKYLIDNGCELYNDTPENTIIEFATFSDLILSQGTFSWWMGFLSDGKKHCLIPNTGWNSENSGIKLLPNDDSWFLYKNT